jgi:ribosomal protein L16 Arg81 hydroxylase
VSFPEYAHTSPVTADLQPGDVLYVPPYWFHHVESLTASISLSTWSVNEPVHSTMKQVYAHVMEVDTLPLLVE